MEDLQARFTIEFKNLANEILEEKSKKFTEQNKINLNDILKPLGEKIKDFEKKVEAGSAGLYQGGGAGQQRSK